MHCLEAFFGTITFMNMGAFKMKEHGLYSNKVFTIDSVYTLICLARAPSIPTKECFSLVESFTDQMPPFTEQLQCANHCPQPESEIHYDDLFC